MPSWLRPAAVIDASVAAPNGVKSGLTSIRATELTNGLCVRDFSPYRRAERLEKLSEYGLYVGFRGERNRRPWHLHQALK